MGNENVIIENIFALDGVSERHGSRCPAFPTVRLPGVFLVINRYFY